MPLRRLQMTEFASQRRRPAQRYSRLLSTSHCCPRPSLAGPLDPAIDYPLAEPDPVCLCHKERSPCDRMNVRKAVVLAAGFGTRFLPATKAVPKEMLPLVDRPVIQYIVEEALAAGLEQIIMVTSGPKRSIEDHFDRQFELESILEAGQKHAHLTAVRQPAEVTMAFVRQRERLGNGHAVLITRPFVGDE